MPPKEAQGHRERSAFPPIADFGFLSDCETTALVASTGQVEWLCLPRMDSPAAIATILDRDAGGFRFAPADVLVPAARRYLPGTLALETTWMAQIGWLTVTDVLLIGPWEAEGERPEYRRTPRDHRAAHVLLRTALCQHGEVELVLDCNLRPGYGEAQAEWTHPGGDLHRAIANGPDLEPPPELVTSLRTGFESGRVQGRTTLREGERAFAALSWSGGRAPTTIDEAEARLAETLYWWREWLERGSFPDHPWRTHLQRSALVLKGLTYTPTGAMIAASTTSLPETPGGERNWDYRFTWIRDSAFMLWAFYTLGFEWEANDFFHFVADQCTAEQPLQIMYGIGGEDRLDERQLENLTGYDGARPVRVGNDAYRQAQHDVWGMVLDSVYLHTRSLDHLPEWLWPLVEAQVEEALAHWREPDHGIWEVRGERRHFTSSKVLCWVAGDRGVRLALMRGEEATAARWQERTEEIRHDVCEHAVDERGVFTQHYDTTALDAATLLIPLMRFLPPDDDRVRRTVLAIADELTDDDLVLRYRLDETDDGLEGEEGTFTICSFWLVSALVEIGEEARARRLCEKLLSYASPLELYAEQIDSHTGRQLGNFPQAFSHLALINAVMHVVRADRHEPPGRFRPATAASPGRPR